MSRLYRQLDALQLLIFNLIRAQAQRRNVNYDRLANVNGVRLHYSRRDRFRAETVTMWRPLMVKLAKSRLVIAPDLWFSLIIKASRRDNDNLHSRS